MKLEMNIRVKSTRRWSRDDDAFTWDLACFSLRRTPEAYA